MTTRRTAESLLFSAPVLNTGAPATSGDNDHYRTLPEPLTTSPSPTRRRIQPIYCPRCAGWVEVRSNPIRLRCVRCGLEAKP